MDSYDRFLYRYQLTISGIQEQDLEIEVFLICQFIKMVRISLKRTAAYPTTTANLLSGLWRIGSNKFQQERSGILSIVVANPQTIGWRRSCPHPLIPVTMTSWILLSVIFSSQKNKTEWPTVSCSPSAFLSLNGFIRLWFRSQLQFQPSHHVAGVLLQQQIELETLW